VWIAPHLGDLADGRSHDHWQAGLDALLARHGAQLQTLCSDQHPGYRSVQWALQRCSGDAPWQHRAVQHHQAHGLAVLAEHGRRPPALVIAFDGLGFGAGAAPLWGGEVLQLSADGSFQRRMALRPFPLPGGERAMAEPRRAALGLLASCGEAALQHPGAGATLAAFTAGERSLLLQALAAGVHCPQTSSVGRLFDAVASLLDLVQRLSYEGQGGLLLQGAAEDLQDADRSAPAPALPAPYPLPLLPAPDGAGVPQWFDWQPLLLALLADRAAGLNPGSCALRFHAALIEVTSVAAAAAALTPPQRRQPVLLAGGCFQNRLLLQGAITALHRGGHEPLWAQQLPCGDGGLALGQLLAAGLRP
ncbi:MAG: carbamoyltransferase HypF, partial [Cyanobacteriota bacterium]|nr:carbamoyltransferase HypF [Cyanobacteriota bacterium]